MNKRKVDDLIPKAVEILTDTGIVNKEGKIKKTYRGQISTFGAAIINGSLISAVAFFSDNGNSSTERSKLIEAIGKLIPESREDLFEYVKKSGKSKKKEVKEEILNAAIALKLAMNLYNLEKETEE